MDIQIDGLSKEALLDADKVNNGVWIHLESASTDASGHTSPLYLGGDKTKPQRVKVRSYRCKVLKDLEASRQKEGFSKMRVAKKKEKDDVITESAIIPEEERFGYWLVALENFSAAGGVQELTPEQARSLHSNTALDNIIQQVKETAYEDANYLADAGTSAGNGSASTAAARSTTPEKEATSAQA
jgi:hypothetical protein